MKVHKSKPNWMNGYVAISLVVGLVLGWWIRGGNSPSIEQKEHTEHGVEETVQEEPTLWTCSMHPQIQEKSPGKCRLCGMDLIPVESDTGDEGPRQLSMSEAAMKLAEIQTAPAQRMFVEHESRLVGKIEYDETRTKSITAWFPGRLERLFVDYTGTPVKKSEHLLEIYSPDIRTDQEALVQALRSVRESPASADPVIQRNRIDVLQKARERLRLLGLTEEQIKEIEERGEPSERIVFYSPIDGIVIHKSAIQGDYVQTGHRIYTIADLTHVWLKMDAYESDLQWIRYGHDVEFTTVAHPGEIFHGRVSFIDPFLSEKTRTVKIRVNVENADGKLKPEMFVRAVVRSKVTQDGKVIDEEIAGKWICSMHPEILKDVPGFCDICEMPLVTVESVGFVAPEEGNQEPPLVIPTSAVLVTGKRAVVYVRVPNTDKPKFEGREIVLGPRLNDYYAVESGLMEGEDVVINGGFKIDSALQIQAKPSMMSPDGGVPPPGHAHSGTTKPAETAAEPSPSQESAMPPTHVLPLLLPHYRELASALVADQLENAQRAANQLAESAQAHEAVSVQEMAMNLGDADSLESARKNFSLLSEVLIQALSATGAPKETLYVTQCPMAFDGRGARWLQWNEEVLNPYFGDVMLNCGAVEREIPQNETAEAPRAHSGTSND